MKSSGHAFSPTAFLILLMIGLMMGANHVGARIAFANGLSVATAVACRSTITALVVGLLIIHNRVRLTTLSYRLKLSLLMIGLLIGLQSQSLYSAVSRLPVALALLAFNTYPLFTAFWDFLIYKNPPSRPMMISMPVILIGLSLALDVFGSGSGLDAMTHWSQIGAGVLFALAAAAFFGLALILTQHETQKVDGLWRTLSNMTIAGTIAIVFVVFQGGPQWPTNSTGWLGLTALTLLYGTAFTIMFMVLPRLGAAKYSAIMNVEPIFALVLAWLILDQGISAIQLMGALMVVATVVWLGLKKH
jgi:drug/metabolite transporter (DMT)-like permease